MAESRGNQDRAARIRERMRTLNGEPPSEATARQAMDELGQRNRERIQAQDKVSTEANEAFAPLLSRLGNVMGEDALRGVGQQLRAIASKRAETRLRDPARPAIEPRIVLGSLNSVFAPPYDFDWTDGGGASANRNAGDIGFAIGNFGEGGTKHASAGVGVWFTPVTELPHVQFRFGASWSYDWWDSSEFVVARNRAWLNLFVVETDRDGANGHAIIDDRRELWNDGTGWLEEHGDHNWGLVGGFETIPFPARPDKAYQLWSWCHGEVYANEIFTGVSFAQAQLNIHIPAMSTKEV